LKNELAKCQDTNFKNEKQIVDKDKELEIQKQRFNQIKAAIRKCGKIGEDGCYLCTGCTDKEGKVYCTTSGVYDIISAPCRSAQHAGVISSTKEGGLFKVKSAGTELRPSVKF